MKNNDYFSTNEFSIKYCGSILPFEFFSLEYILSELEKHKEMFGSFLKMENATKASIKKIYNENKESLGENTRFFAYIKFFTYNGKDYGLVGGKTNYNNPDLSFDYLSSNEGKEDNRFARIFLEQENVKWCNTIVIVNHKASPQEENDNKEALFIECCLQRKFNLFNS